MKPPREGFDSLLAPGSRHHRSRGRPSSLTSFATKPMVRANRFDKPSPATTPPFLPLLKESRVDSTSSGRHRRRRGLTSFLAAGAIVAGSVVTVTAPALAADESISVNFSAAGAGPHYPGSGGVYR